MLACYLFHRQYHFKFNIIAVSNIQDSHTHHDPPVDCHTQNLYIINLHISFTSGAEYPRIYIFTNIRQVLMTLQKPE